MTARTKRGTWPPLPALREWTTRLPGPENAYCPLCRCNKSGDVLEPNGYSPACTDSGCRCHSEVAG